MQDHREQAKALMSERSTLELEADAIFSELNQTGTPPVGVKGALVDSEGFPRGDIDIYRVRELRNRLSVINTNHKEVMNKIESLLPLLLPSNAD
jgi:26S proteasome regulatory subunit N4